MKSFIIIFLVCFNLYGKNITPSEVYTQVIVIEDEIHYLLKYFNLANKYKKVENRIISTELKPRNVWQKTYEIMIKINILRNKYSLPRIEPVNMSPVLNLNPDSVYEQVKRILTEIEVFKVRVGIKSPDFNVHKYKNKKPIDVFNKLSYVSNLLDILNRGEVTSSSVFSENMRIYDDILLILDYLNIDDNTIPANKNNKATSTEAFYIGMKTLEKIKQIQILAGIEFIDFNEFKKDKHNSSEVFEITQMIISELQTVKAYIGVDSVTVPGRPYKTKTAAEVEQLMSWNLRKLNLINMYSFRR